MTLLLVEGFTGSTGNDVDADDDGLLDTIFWTRIVDSVAVDDGGAGDGHYSPAVLAPGFDGDATIPGGASRIPDGADTDTAADWLRNDFDGAGLPGFTGTPVFGEAYNTPGASNQAVPAPVADLVINEIDYDQPCTDTAEFIEIKNNGATAVDLDPYSLVLVNQRQRRRRSTGPSTCRPSRSPPAATTWSAATPPTSSTATSTPPRRLDLIQNGSPDAVALVAGATIVDTVSYEGDTVAPYTEGSGAGLEDPGTAGSDFLGISRFPDGADTDVNNVDLSTALHHPRQPPTPAPRAAARRRCATR